MTDEIKDLHREQHRKGIEMYQAGVASGIRYAIDRSLSFLDGITRECIVDQLIKDYGNER